MTRILGLFIVFSVFHLSGCGSPSAEMVFNTSTEAYPVISDSEANALEAAGGAGSGLPVTSVVRIQQPGLTDDKMEEVHLQSLVLKSKEGDLRFIQLARCYVQSRSAGAKTILVGTAKSEDVDASGRSLRFHVDSGPDLVGILKSPFQIVVEIEGDSPLEKVSVSADLTFKSRVKI